MKILKKCMPVLVALILIFVISIIYIVPQLYEKYSYSDEEYDLNEYFQIFTKDDVPIILQTEVLEDNAKQKYDTFYLAYDTVKNYFTNRFYVNEEEKIICFTLPDQVVKAEIGEEVNVYYKGEEQIASPYPIAFYEGESLYIAIDYVKMFTNFSYEVFENPTRMQVYTEWTTMKAAKVTKNSKVRYRGGVKSEVLTPVTEGDQVFILEEYEDWDQVQTMDGFIGYLEKKVLGETYEYEQTPVHDAIEMDYSGKRVEGKVNLAFHQVFVECTGKLLREDMTNSKSVNVVAPTWFRPTDAYGNFQSLANADYVSTAHEMGLQVWAVFTDVDEVSKDVDEYTLFSSSLCRQALISNLVDKVLEFGVDGINIDFENIDSATAPHFVQFLRELSIETRKNGLILSVDNYVPTASTSFYNRKEQGIVCDYVVIMGYDEHWSGASEAGSVASIEYVTNGIADTVNSVPAKKVINAIPFYTRIWCTNGAEVSSETVGMQMANDWVAARSITPVWDEVTCQNYATYEIDGKVYEVWLEDAESIAVKLNVMNQQGIAGVAAWKLGMETDDVWDTIAGYMNQ